MLDNTVVALLNLTFYHAAVLNAHTVVFVAFKLNGNALVEILDICALIDKGKLHVDRRIKVIEKIAIVTENHFLILCLRKLKVNVVELHGFGVFFVVHTANTVAVHFLIGNTLLYRLRCFTEKTRKETALF